MQINVRMIQEIDWTDHRGTRNSQKFNDIEQKLIQKHSVFPGEVDNAFVYGQNPVGYFNVGEADDPELDGIRGFFFGKVEHARYLTMIAIVKPDGEAIVLSAKEMKPGEKSRYKNHVSTQLI